MQLGFGQRSRMGVGETNLSDWLWVTGSFDFQATPTKNLNVANQHEYGSGEYRQCKTTAKATEQLAKRFPLTGDWKDGYWLGTSDTVTGPGSTSSVLKGTQKAKADHTDEAVINTKYDYSKPMIIDARMLLIPSLTRDKLYAYARK